MGKRLLTPDEIECRVQQTDDKTYATFLLYKTARTDAAILTELYGNAWMNTYQTIDGKLYCTISVFDSSINQWISRMDVGTESNVEVEKGLASDAFKRAGFKWGIGDELYSAPNIKVQLTEGDCYNGKCRLKLRVSEIDYNENNKINRLTLVDNFNRVRYTYPQQQHQQQPVQAPIQQSQYVHQPQPQPVQTPFQPQTAPVTPQPVQYDKAALIENLKANARVEASLPHANVDMLKKFVTHYIERISNVGWQGNFDFDFLWQRWQKNNTKKTA